MSFNNSQIFDLPLDPEQNPYLDERRNYDPNQPKRKPRPTKSDETTPATVLATSNPNAEANEVSGDDSEEGPRATAPNANKSSEEYSQGAPRATSSEAAESPADYSEELPRATTPNMNIHPTPQPNLKEKRKIAQEKRWAKIKALKPDLLNRLLKQRRLMAKQYYPNERLFYINTNTVDPNGERKVLKYKHAHRMDWSDKRWIKALNRWRSRTFYTTFGPINRRQRPAIGGIPFTVAEREYLRSHTTLNMGEDISREDWAYITEDFNARGRGNDRRPVRTSKQLQDLRHTLDIEDVEG